MILLHMSLFASTQVFDPFDSLNKNIVRSLILLFVTIGSVAFSRGAITLACKVGACFSS